MADETTNARGHLVGPVFEAVHRQGIFTDSKRFADALPLYPPSTIVRRYETRRDRPEFDLRTFIDEHFELPSDVDVPSSSNGMSSLDSHIDAQWATLRRPLRASNEYDSLISLPYPHVVPGGRFREMYYWDSYFVAEGLAATGRHDRVHEMVVNLAHLIDRFGYVPNGNQRYYLGRSQPPLFCRMVELLAETEPSAVSMFLHEVRAEYQFWMDGIEPPASIEEPGRRVVSIDGTVLNRYWGDTTEPRLESYREDLDVAMGVPQPRRPTLYRDIRAACESGWDFSSRWLENPQVFPTIRTTQLVPVDLNSCLCYTEYRIADWLKAEGESELATRYRDAARSRREAISEYCWDDEAGYFFDYSLQEGTTDRWTLAGAVPLHFGLATDDQAMQVAKALETKFLRRGGLVTTLTRSGQQWDAPNGWAPLQWFAVTGLRRYGLHDLAETVKARWLETVEGVFDRTGQLYEKYDVVDQTRRAVGGEYPSQSGFAWTNGVVLALRAEPRPDRLELGDGKGPIRR